MPFSPAAQLSPCSHLLGIVGLISNSQCEEVPSASAPESCCRFLVHEGFLCNQPEVGWGAPRPTRAEPPHLHDGFALPKSCIFVATFRRT